MPLIITHGVNVSFFTEFWSLLIFLGPTNLWQDNRGASRKTPASTSEWSCTGNWPRGRRRRNRIRRRRTQQWLPKMYQKCTGWLYIMLQRAQKDLQNHVLGCTCLPVLCLFWLRHVLSIWRRRFHPSTLGDLPCCVLLTVETLPPFLRTKTEGIVQVMHKKNG